MQCNLHQSRMVNPSTSHGSLLLSLDPYQCGQVNEKSLVLSISKMFGTA